MSGYFKSILPTFARIKQSSLVRSLVVYSSSAGLAQVFLILYAILVARYLGPKEYGVFAGNYALAGITVFIINWGIDTWMLHQGGTHSEPRRLTSTVIQRKLGIGLIWLFILVSTGPYLNPNLYRRDLLFLCGIDTLADTLLITLVAGLNISKTSGRASIVLITNRIFRLVTAILFILFGADGVLIFVIGRCLATVCGVLLGVFYLKPIWSVWNLEFSQPSFRILIPYGIPELLGIIYAQADVTIIGMLAGDRDVGLYSPAVSLINGFSIVFNAYFSLFIPSLVRGLASGRQKLTYSLIQMFAVYIATGFVLTISVVLLIRPVVNIVLGMNYEFSSFLVMLLSPILILKSVSFWCATILVATGKQAKRIVPQMVSAAVNIALNFVFIPLAGITAAAIIYVFSEFCLMVGYLIVTWRSGDYNNPS